MNLCCGQKLENGNAFRKDEFCLNYFRMFLATAASSLTFATFSSCFNGFWIKAKALFPLRILFLFLKKMIICDYNDVYAA